MTKENFLAFYPQFMYVSQIVMDTYIEQANNRFEECLDSAEEARRLYTAHKLTLWAQTYIEPGQYNAAIPASRLASAGVAAQQLSKSVGGVSVSKSEGSAVSSISGYGELKQTEYGVQLISLLKMAAAPMRYVP